MQYYTGIQGVQSGPFSEAELREKLAQGALPAGTLCWTEGWSEWRLVHTVFPTPSGLRPPPIPSASFTPPPSVAPQPVPSGPPATSGLAITSFILGVLGLLVFLTSI